MSYIEKSISIYGTELQFIQAFINAITAADSRITCTTDLADLAAQFNGNDTSIKPTFELSVHGIYTITFTRGEILNNPGYRYLITCSAFSGYVPLDFRSGSASRNEKTTRTWKFSVMANDENIYLKLAVYNGNLNLPTEKWLSVKINNISACSWNNGSYNIMTSGFVASGGQVYTRINRLPYTYNASDLTSIEVMKSKVFVENSTTNRAFETSKIIDSTTVTADQVISINSVKYYALDSNTLMEI